MRAKAAVAQILKREGVELLIAYPINHLIEAAAEAGIRTVIVRQERIGVHIADALSRVSSGHRVGVFAMQLGPGAENAFGGVAQAYGDSTPILVLPMGYPRQVANRQPYFSALLNYRNVTKHIEQVPLASAVPDAMRRAFTQVRSGRPRPVLVEFPMDLLDEEVPEPLSYAPTFPVRSAPDPDTVDRAAQALLAAARPVLHAGQGIHYAQAWPELRELAELLSIPVSTTLQGKSAFPENHPLSLGCGGRTSPDAVLHFLQEADLILGVGCSFFRTDFGVAIPKAKTVIHATLDTADLNANVTADYALVGDAQLTLRALIARIRKLLGGRRGDSGKVIAEIGSVKGQWLARWLPELASDRVPLSPYRVIWDLMHTVDRADTIITHDSGSPRDMLSPFWETVAPLSYIGWGNSTQLGTGLGFAMGAKLAEPNKLCVAVMGDAAFGMTGMDFETAVRERIPVLVIVLNNFSMACEIPIMRVSTDKYGSTNISGNYAALATSLGGYAERVSTPDSIVPAIRRGIEKTKENIPVLLEFITTKDFDLPSMGY